MRLPRSLPARIAWALVGAALAIGVLDLVVAAWDRHRPPARPHRGETERLAAEAEAEDAAALLPAAPGAASPAELHLRPVAGLVALAHRRQSLPPDVAPVVEVLADGALVLRRPPPLATAPLDAGAPAPSGLGAAVLVPGDDLDGLSARARAALLGVIGELVGERPVPLVRLQVLDFPAPPAMLHRLLSWLP